MAGSLIQNTVNNVADALAGKTPHNTLQTFLQGVSNAHSNNVKIKQPDPLNTFDIRFKFFPCKFSNPNAKKGIWTAAGDALVGAAKSATKNVIGNITGGLLGSFMNKVDIQAEHDKHTTIKTIAENLSFIEYLAKANLLCGTESTWFGGIGEITSPLEIDMTYFVLKMTLPHLKAGGQDEQCDTKYMGKFPIAGSYVEPETHTVMLNVLNTSVPVLERIFYPWMREVTLPYWSYATQPYTTATITVDLTSHADIRYIFIGCRPTQIESYLPDHATPSDMSRQVTMTFDYMFIDSDMTTTETWQEKAAGLGKTLVNSAANMLKL